MYLKTLFILAITLALFASCSKGRVLNDQLSFSLISQPSLDTIRKELKQAHIVPDILDDFTPSCYVHVIYTSSQEEVRLGHKIKPSNTKNAPVVRVSCQNETDTKGFTIALTDPDAPSRKDPKWSEMCHWIATLPNTRGPLQDSEDSWVGISEGPKEIVEYKPPGPPSKTGYHRYIFVLLIGDNTNLTAPSERKHWGTGKERHGVRDWAEKEGLEIIGANFFYARHENSTIELGRRKPGADTSDY